MRPPEDLAHLQVYISTRVKDVGEELAVAEDHPRVVQQVGQSGEGGLLVQWVADESVGVGGHHEHTHHHHHPQNTGHQEYEEHRPESRIN